jgi:creatinine amidohydrolase
MREFILAEQTHAFVRQRPWQAAVLPFGATEPHNLHMPYGTDTFQVEELARRACGRAWERGARVALLPAIPFGVNTNHLKVPGALACSLLPTTLLAIISDLAESLSLQGVKRLVLLNGHGGNELKPLARQLHHRSDVFLCICDWYRMAGDLYPGIFEQPGEHADEVETSIGAGLLPDADAPRTGRRRPGRAVAVRRDQPRLGEHHPAVAPGERQHRPGQPEGGHGGEGPAADGGAHGAPGRLPCGIGEGGDG